MSKSWKRQRLETYPSVGDQLDAIWMLLSDDKDKGKTLPNETQNMLERVKGVKAAHPKPEHAR